MSESTPQISPEIRKQMESICRRVVNGRDDAARIGDELFGHLEDKLLAYLHGDERLTEADAMILVREHFGRPEKLRAMLNDVDLEPPAADDTTPLSKRLLISALAMSVVQCVVPVIAVFANQALRWVDPQYSAAPSRSIASVILSLIATVAFYKLAKRWHREPNVVHRCKPLILISGLLSLAALQPLALVGLHRMFAKLDLPVAANAPQSQWFWWSISALSLALYAVQAHLWIRLSSRGRAWSTVFIASGAWVAFWAATRLLQIAIGQPLMMAGNSASRNAIILITWAAIAAGVGLLLIPMLQAVRWSIDRASRVRLTLATRDSA